MPRIRTVKPDFWMSEQVGKCSIPARLLFIGLWNYCDDQGIHPASFYRLRLEIFAGDNFTDKDISQLISELLNAGLLIEYEAKNKIYWKVTGWHHQKINRPNAKFPDLSDSCKIIRGFSDNSMSTHGILMESSWNPHGAISEPHPEEEEEEEDIDIKEKKNIKEKKSAKNIKKVSDDKSSSEKPLRTSPIPYKKIINLWHEKFKGFPVVEVITPKLKSYIRRTSEMINQILKSNDCSLTQNNLLEMWDSHFESLKRSDWLMGRADPSKYRDKIFRLNFEFSVNPNKYLNVREGKYE
jgi:hypothetical protein